MTSSHIELEYPSEKFLDNRSTLTQFMFTNPVPRFRHKVYNVDKLSSYAVYQTVRAEILCPTTIHEIMMETDSMGAPRKGQGGSPDPPGFRHKFFLISLLLHLE